MIALAAAAATAAAPQSTDEKPAAPPIERSTAWPALAPETLAQVRTDVERLRKARTPEMGEQAAQALIAAGAGAVPELLPVLGKEKDEAARERIDAVLVALTGAAHTRLVAESFADKSRDVRTWALHRVALFPDSGVREKAEAALAAARKQAAKGEEAIALEYERYCAALCATSAGSIAGLDLIERAVLESWGKRGGEIRTALEAVRGKDATERAAVLVRDTDRKKIVAGLNLLAGCGSRESVALVRPHLDSQDNSIRVAAINAMRGIVDGDLPIANLPVFEAIELAKKWKEKG
jgi:hypothetical protein